MKKWLYSITLGIVFIFTGSLSALEKNVKLGATQNQVQVIGIINMQKATNHFLKETMINSEEGKNIEKLQKSLEKNIAAVEALQKKLSITNKENKEYKKIEQDLKKLNTIILKDRDSYLEKAQVLQVSISSAFQASFPKVIKSISQDKKLTIVFSDIIYPMEKDAQEKKIKANNILDITDEVIKQLQKVIDQEKQTKKTNSSKKQQKK